MIDCQYELIYVFANANFGKRYPFAEGLEDRQRWSTTIASIAVDRQMYMI